MSDHVQPSISDLMDDIATFRTLILYYENRILRKQIAIAELLAGQQVREDTATPPPIAWKKPEGTVSPSAPAHPRRDPETI